MTPPTPTEHKAQACSSACTITPLTACHRAHHIYQYAPQLYTDIQRIAQADEESAAQKRIYKVMVKKLRQVKTQNHRSMRVELARLQLRAKVQVLGAELKEQKRKAREVKYD